MPVFLAEHAGYCNGVQAAIDITLEQINKSRKVYTLGPLVHNEEVLNFLESQGVIVAETPQDAVQGTIVIRTHGVAPDVLAYLQGREDLEIVDATCPYVRRVQTIAGNFSQKGYDIIIFGDRQHPEVQALLGWVKAGAFMLEPGEISQHNDIPLSPKSVLISQTTQRKKEYFVLAETLKQRCPSLKVCQTICRATEQRQEAAAALAAKVDLMLVVGDKRSSNTQKLVQVCREITKTYQVAGASEIGMSWSARAENVGITAGASTPHWTIKEVKEKMEEMERMEQEQNMQNEEKVQEEISSGNAVREYHPGDIVSGKVLLVDDDQVLMDIGYKTEATLPRREVFLEGEQTIKDQFSIGDIIDILILKIVEQDDKIIVSRKRLQREQRWKELEEAMKIGTNVQGMVKNVVPRGIIIDLGSGMEGFMPGSLVDIKYIPDFTHYRGEMFTFRVLELNRERDKIILSRKQYLEKELETKKQETIEKIKEGDIINGVVKRLTDFGAFVDVGYIDGLVHISEVSWQRVGHPRDALKVGEEVPVKVLEVIPERERISLSIRQAQPDPWTVAGKDFNANDIVTGRVTRIVNFGVFVELLPGVEGLVHISQLADFHVKHPSEVVKEGEEIEVKIIDVNIEAKRISLSIKDAHPAPRDFSVQATQNEDNQGVTFGDVFGDLFNHNKIKEED